jgi:protein-disulfide isomerase
MHDNACWAARAAEAAGMLRGTDGFWQMHHWLFQRRGSFTDADFPPALRQLGYDPQQFISTMMSAQTLDRVKSDIEEGADLGLFFTPMIFINGVELRGFIGQPGALAQAIDQLAASHPPPASPARDRPPRAARKYVEDWSRDARVHIPPVSRPHRLGPANARVVLVVWGDLQDPLTAELDRLIRQRMRAGDDILYEYRHYPFDQSCNSLVPRTVYPSGCMAARAAEAAGMLGGDEAFWKMQQWLLSHQSPLDNQRLAEAAAAAGVDATALLTNMNDAALHTALQQDVRAAGPFIRQGVPTLNINGRWAPRWKLEGADILRDIIEQAQRE